MLIKFSNLNKYGNSRSRIIFVKNPPFSYNPEGLGRFVGTQRFKYDYEGFLPPGLLTNIKGERYITPSWQRVHPETTLSDINWIKPVVKKSKPTKPQTWEFKSSSSDQIYTVVKTYENKLKCDCMGFWRSRGNCKHVKEVKQKLND
jgi:hypothetical protein